MGMSVAYEAVSLIMLLITIFFYNYKNWLSLRKNQIYIGMLVLSVVTIFVDILLGECTLYFPAQWYLFEKISGIWMSITFPVLYLHFLLYDLALTKKSRVKKSGLFQVFLVVFAGITAFSVVTIASDYPTHILKIGNTFCRVENLLQIMLLNTCLFAGLYFVIRNRKMLTKRELYVLVCTNIVLLFGAELQVFFENTGFVSYYLVTIVLLLYYLVLHNSDQYRFLSSRCFSRAGFHTVMEEKTHYRENIACLGICINNIESITNYCTEQEITQLHRRMGEMIRFYCGRHNTYNIHSFEYMAMLKNSESVTRIHREMAERMPQYIRLNGKNIPLSCNFYMVELADAGFHARDFNRILFSMRKLATTSLNPFHLFTYQGERQAEIQNDLEAMRMVNANIASHSFHYEMLPIQSLRDASKQSLEMVLCEHLENDEVVSQERIWELATETGYIKEVGYIACEMLCDYFHKKHVLESDKIEQLHLNLSSKQILNCAAAEKYIKILKEQDVPGERVCFEITIDQDVDYAALSESISALREYGIRLLLDQFGVCVCNLKSTLNMPFDSVKLNNYMVQTYCIGESRQLIYLINMLRDKGWSIYLDGVDRLEQIDLLMRFEVSYIQGYALRLEPFRHEIRESLAKRGGASDD